MKRISKPSKTSVSFQMMDKFIAHREGKISTAILNDEILCCLEKHSDLLIINGDFHKSVYNILGKNRVKYIKQICNGFFAPNL